MFLFFTTYATEFYNSLEKLVHFEPRGMMTPEVIQTIKTGFEMAYERGDCRAGPFLMYLKSQRYLPENYPDIDWFEIPTLAAKSETWIVIYSIYREIFEKMRNLPLLDLEITNSNEVRLPGSGYQEVKDLLKCLTQYNNEECLGLPSLFLAKLFEENAKKRIRVDPLLGENFDLSNACYDYRNAALSPNSWAIKEREKFRERYPGITMKPFPFEEEAPLGLDGIQTLFDLYNDRLTELNGDDLRRRLLWKEQLTIHGMGAADPFFLVRKHLEEFNAREAEKWVHWLLKHASHYLYFADAMNDFLDWFTEKLNKNTIFVVQNKSACFRMVDFFLHKLPNQYKVDIDLKILLEDFVDLDIETSLQIHLRNPILFSLADLANIMLNLKRAGYDDTFEDFLLGHIPQVPSSSFRKIRIKQK